MEEAKKTNYFVLINEKFMLKLIYHYGTASQVEQEIMSKYDGVQTVQAFDYEGMKSIKFRYRMFHSEFITEDDLRQMSDTYKANWQKASEAKKDRKAQEGAVELLRDALDDAYKKLEESIDAENKANEQALDWQKKVMGVRDNAC